MPLTVAKAAEKEKKKKIGTKERAESYNVGGETNPMERSLAEGLTEVDGSSR